MPQERTRQLTAEKYESIKREYLPVIADIDVIVDEMVACTSLLPTSFPVNVSMPHSMGL